MKQLHVRAREPTTAIVDVVSWLNFTTFDLFGELMYGESYGCLESGEEHPWIKFFFGSTKMLVMAQEIPRLPSYLRPLVYLLMLLCLPWDIKTQINLTKEKTDERMAKGVTDKGDFSTHLQCLVN